MHQRVGQQTLAESWLAARLGRNRRLDAIDALVDWSCFERLLSGLHRAPTGRPSYPPLLMFKALLLQTWYELGDPALEEARSDRLSFRRFVGLGLEDPTPDHSTVSRFRSALGAAGLDQPLLAELQRQLDARGLLVKQGTMLDASVIEAQVRRPPRSAGKGAPSPADPEAGWGGRSRGARSVFGYKLHAGVDQGSGLIRRALLTPANIYESAVAEALICGDERAVYADKAYESQPAPAAAAGARGQGPDQAPGQQVASPAAPLASRAQPLDRTAPARGGAGLRHAQTQLRLPPGALPRSAAQPGRTVLQGLRLQPAPRAQPERRRLSRHARPADAPSRRSNRRRAVANRRPPARDPLGHRPSPRNGPLPANRDLFKRLRRRESIQNQFPIPPQTSQALRCCHPRHTLRTSQPATLARTYV